MSGPDVVMVARTPTIGELIEKCARGDLPFSGPNSLYSKVHAMGYRCTGLYEMVMACKASLGEAEGPDEVEEQGIGVIADEPHPNP